ncbi:VIT domain-containing protein, partial [Stella sp.]|uniref:VIT domain-containing protein n=1 Tax=Stella sp. TaxID=2912054 RepID=UPI0035B1BFB1
MTIPLPALTTDPLASLVAGAFVAGSTHPIPLVETHFDIVTEAGLATVSTRRVFRNVEAESIEATITFPMPVGATLFRLEARIGARTLTATAQARGQARDRYERAIDDGRSAVLHEELLRGVHMLSVAHVPPGAEIAVTSEWAIALTMVAGAGRLRIPLTIGDVYGRSGLLEADAPLQGAPPQTATLSVRSDAAAIWLGTGTLADGMATVPMNQPIDLEFAGWPRRPLVARAADGRTVTLDVAPLDDGEADLNVALLVDHSSSMDAPASGRSGPLTKHQALVAGLQQLDAALRPSDRIELWEFSDRAQPVAPGRRSHGADAPGLGQRAACLSPPDGGTRIGHALHAVVDGATAPDVLLVTDGKSYDLDPHALAKAGRRIVVVLVGQD